MTTMQMEVAVSESAVEAIRFSFNPSGDPQVIRLKTLAAMFISECERIRASNPAAGRNASIAITEMEGASMRAVLAATTGVK